MSNGCGPTWCPKTFWHQRKLHSLVMVTSIGPMTSGPKPFCGTPAEGKLSRWQKLWMAAMCLGGGEGWLQSWRKQTPTFSSLDLIISLLEVFQPVCKLVLENIKVLEVLEAIGSILEAAWYCCIGASLLRPGAGQDRSYYVERAMWGKGKEGKGKPAEALRSYRDQDLARSLG